MGHCCSKIAVDNETIATDHNHKPPNHAPSPLSQPISSVSDATPGRQTPATSFSTSPFNSPLPAGVMPSPATKTPGRKFRWPLPPPSPAKPIMAALLRRQGKTKPKDGPIPEEQGGEGGGEGERTLDKSFGYGKNFGAKFELG
ncbi:CDPK-related kinase 4-like, partial [Trifolium medium]|nr:CDPK-related kinase 4-like [Trifolium medium]